MFLAFWMLVAISTSISSIHTVQAQNETILNIEPADVVLDLDSSTTVTVKVINGSNLNAYDITISYEPGILNLESWSHGSYMSNLAVLINENQPGKLHLVVIQLARPGVSGSGTLLNLTFKGIQTGTSEIYIEHAEFATSSSELVIPRANSGVITVSLPVTLTPTFTITPTATRTFTPTLTRTPTLTPTRTLTPSTHIPPGATTSLPVPTSGPGTSTPVPVRSSQSPNPPPAVLETENQPQSVTSSSGVGLIYPKSKRAPTDSTSEIGGPTIEPKDADNKLSKFNTFLWISVVVLIILFLCFLVVYFIRKNKRN